MKSVKKRVLACVLVLVLVISAIPCTLAASSYTYNSGTRHVTATSLSSSAEAYYTGSYTYASLSSLTGGTSTSGLSTMDSALYQALQSLMASTQTKILSYSSLTTYYPYTDCEDSSGTITYIYSDAAPSGTTSREHVWPKSHASFQQTNGGSDLYNLRPEDSTINSKRGNYTFGNVVDTLTSYSTASFSGSTVLYYSSSANLVEVNDDIKGDVARTLLYVYVRWGQPNLFEDVSSSSLPSNDSGSSNDGEKVIESLQTLLEWCQEDPVDEWEMGHNDAVEAIQGNRNVFVDYPELAWLLFGLEVPDDLVTPSGEAMSGSTFTLTALVNNSAYGSVSVSGNVITATPADGYYVSGATLTSGSASVSVSGNTITVSNMSSDCTVTVIFSAQQAASLTLMADGSVDTVLSGYIGQTVTLPTTATTPDDYTFLGWSTATVDSTQTAPSYLQPGASYTLDGDDTLYALYSYRDSQGDDSGAVISYSPVTTSSSDYSGVYVITGIVSSSGDEYVLNGDNTGTAAGGASQLLSTCGITKSGDLLSGVSDTYIFTVAKDSGSDTYTILANSGEYLAYQGTSNSLTTLSSVSDAARWTITYDSSSENLVITNVGTTTRVLQFNASSKQFRCYTNTQQPVHLYAATGSYTTYYTTGSEALGTPAITSVYANKDGATASQARVKISWTAVDGADGYLLYRSTSADGEYTLVKTITSGSTTSYSNNGLTLGQTYYYKVCAYTLCDDGSKRCSAFSGTCYTPACATFTSVYANATDRVRLLWNAVDGAEGYQIWRADSADGEYKIVKTITSGDTTAYSNNGLEIGQTYYYKIRAYATVNGQKVFGAYSDVSAVTTLYIGSTTMTAASYSTGIAKLAWNAVDGAEGYQIWRADSEDGTYSIVKTITSGSTTSYSNNGLTSGKTYYYKIRAYSVVDGSRTYGGYSTVVSVTAK
ncbi:MAG: endonuclease [Firmicutes bacterium]|nr:endonuclease [Bacillota bacterium]